MKFNNNNIKIVDLFSMVGIKKYDCGQSCKKMPTWQTIAVEVGKNKNLDHTLRVDQQGHYKV